VLNATGTVINAENLPSFLREKNEELVNPNPFSQELETKTPDATDSRDNAGTRRPNEYATNCESYRSVDRTDDGREDCTSDCSADSKEKLFDFIDQRVTSGSIHLYAEALERMERLLFTRVLDLAGGNQSRTAEILGITRGKVRDRIASFGIHVEKTISMSLPEAQSSINEK